MSKEKPKSSISKRQIDEEAHNVLEMLSEAPDTANAIGKELNLRYTPTPRQSIIGKMAKLVELKNPQIPEEAISLFVNTQWEGVTAVTLVNHAAAVLNLLSTFSPEYAAKHFSLMTGLTSEQDTITPPFLDGPSVRAASFKIVKPGRLGSILESSLEYAVNKDIMSKSFLELWYNALLPAVGPKGIKKALNGEQAARIIETMTNIDPLDVPDEVIMSLPFLAAFAGSGIAKELPKTKLGQMMPGVASGEHEAAVADRKKSSFPYAEAHHPEQVEVLKALEHFFENTNHAIWKLEKENREHKEAEEEKEKKCQSLEEEVNSLRQKNRELVQENGQLGYKVSKIAQELEDVKRKAALWERETRLKDQEMGSRLRLMEEEQAEKMKRFFYSSSRNLKDNVQALLEENPNSKKVMMLGIAFDALHAKLLKAMGEPANSRISPDLLDSEGDENE